MTKLIETQGKLNWSFYCPGCKCHHGISTIEPHAWQWNWDTNKPTFSPSLRVQQGPECDPSTHLRIPGKQNRICHSVIKDGTLMDGRHRLMKVLLEGRKTIKVVRFDENPTPCRVNE